LVKFKNRSDSPLKKKSRRGDRGYPYATVAFYGPDDQRASKVAVGILMTEDAEAIVTRLFTTDTDARTDVTIEAEILRIIRENGAKSVAMTERIIGCPHEEGKDYPEGKPCPKCPFLAHRDRWTGELIQ
jgi:hypothetical protein